MTNHEEDQDKQARETETLLKILAIGEEEIAAGQTYSIEEVIAEFRIKGLERDGFLLP